MAKLKQVWVSPDGDGWKVHSNGAERAYRHTETKAEAVNIAHGLAENKKAELFVQNEDGKIGWKNSYGNDPFPPRG